MSASFIHSARRMNALQPYFFSRLGQQINELKRSGQEVIRLDMGAPDMPPPPFLREILSRAVLRPDAHSYAPYGGTADFRRALADYYRRRFAVELDPQNEVIGLIGSKEGLFNLSQALLDPGDVVLVPDPGYPIYAIGAQLAGAEVHYLPLRRENGWLPDLEAVEPDVLRRARLLWLNYPNNPTGACAAPEFFEQAVALARQNEIVLAHASAYLSPGRVAGVFGRRQRRTDCDPFQLQDAGRFGQLHPLLRSRRRGHLRRPGLAGGAQRHLPPAPESDREHPAGIGLRLSRPARFAVRVGAPAPGLG